jgi:hypothetical protein
MQILQILLVLQLKEAGILIKPSLEKLVSKSMFKLRESVSVQEYMVDTTSPLSDPIGPANSKSFKSKYLFRIYLFIYVSHLSIVTYLQNY